MLLCTTEYCEVYFWGCAEFTTALLCCLCGAHFLAVTRSEDLWSGSKAECDSKSRGWIHNRSSASDYAELLHLEPPWCWLPMNESPESWCCLSNAESSARKSLHYVLLVMSAPPSFQLFGKYSWTRHAWQVGKIKHSKMLSSSKDGSVTMLAGALMLPC